MQKNNLLDTNIKLSHSRMFLSGIFNARSYQIGKTLINKRQGLKIRSQVQDDLVLFTTTARGFTLIELLVVVLIIGILAAVALPQYQVAVAKSKAATLLPVLKIISDAQQIYRDANGTYASRFDLLDVDLPAGGTLNESGSIMSYPNGKKFDIWTGETNSSIRGFIDNKQTLLLEYYMDGSHYCYAQKTNELANKICKSFSGQGGESWGSYNAYIM